MSRNIASEQMRESGQVRYVNAMRKMSGCTSEKISKGMGGGSCFYSNANIIL